MPIGVSRGQIIDPKLFQDVTIPVPMPGAQNTSEGVQGDGSIATPIKLNLNGLTTNNTPNITQSYIPFYNVTSGLHEKILMQDFFVLIPNGLEFKGIISNADTNPAFPVAPSVGDVWFIGTNNGTVGGIQVEVGDQLIYTSSGWFVMQANTTSWKSPVADILTLNALTQNQLYDVRFVVSAGTFFWWNGILWQQVGSNNTALTNNLGAWNANTNTPTIISGVGNPGDFYTVSVAGTTSIDGITIRGVGDNPRYDNSTSTWQKIDNQGTTGLTEQVQDIINDFLTWTLPLTKTYNDVLNTYLININNATTLARGVAQQTTNAEIVAGTEDTKYVSALGVTTNFLPRRKNIIYRRSVLSSTLFWYTDLPTAVAAMGGGGEELHIIGTFNNSVTISQSCTIILDGTLNGTITLSGGGSFVNFVGVGATAGFHKAAMNGNIVFSGSFSRLGFENIQFGRLMNINQNTGSELIINNCLYAPTLSANNSIVLQITAGVSQEVTVSNISILTNGAFTFYAFKTTGAVVKPFLISGTVNTGSSTMLGLLDPTSTNTPNFNISSN